MTSYITKDEAYLFYPQAADYSEEQVDLALNTSFSLVNSFLDSNLKLPAINSSGDIPYILKLHQAKFLQYVLESMNIGYSDELKNLYDSTAEALKKLTQNELTVSEIQITPIEIGWNIKEIKFQKPGAAVNIKGVPPEISYTLNFKCISPGFPADTSWEIYRSDSPLLFKTINGSFDWTTIEGTTLSVRFDGEFTIGDEFTVYGQPDTKKVVSPNRILKQSEVLYG